MFLTYKPAKGKLQHFVIRPRSLAFYKICSSSYFMSRFRILFNFSIAKRSSFIRKVSILINVVSTYISINCISSLINANSVLTSTDNYNQNVSIEKHNRCWKIIKFLKQNVQITNSNQIATK